MEVDDVQCKFPRASNGKKMGEQYNQDEEEEGEKKRGVAARGGGLDLSGGVGRFYGWPSSRIVRVSRASGGKDRHSKVLTSKGLRDRRVRLSVNTAIQFYDLQDRLGYDQPSKAVEWLLKAAASSIDELPPMNTPFPDTPRQFSDEKRSSTSDHQLGFDSAEVDMDGNGGGDPNYSQNQVTNPSACSSNSENSKGSGLSLSRSESRIKARERAKERVAEKEKEKESEPSQVGSLNPISQTTSFTELLSAGINNVNNSPNSSFHRNPSAGGGGSTNESVFFQKSPRHWSSSTTPMDYFSTSLLGPPTGTRPMQMHLANPPLFSVSGDHNNHPELYSFVPDHLVSVVNSNSNNQNNGGSEYNLNFTISSSSGLAGYNRGTLQSNSSPSQLPHHLQRLIPLTDSSSPQSTFFIGAAAPVENNHYHHQFLSGYDSRLQLCYGDGHANNGTRHSGQKGKGKN